MSVCHKIFLCLGRSVCRLRKFLFSGICRKNVCVFKIDGMGDMIVWLPYMHAIQNWCRSRNYRSVFVVAPHVRELVLRSNCADVVLVQPYRDSRFEILWFQIRFLLCYDISVVINACHLRNDTADCAFPEKITAFHHPENPPPPGNWRWKNSFNTAGTDIFRRYAALLETLKIPLPQLEYDFTGLADPVPGNDLPGSYILFCTEAGDPRRRWENEKFALLADLLIEKFNTNIVLAGKDPASSSMLIRRSKYPERIIDLCGKTSLSQLITLVLNSNFAVSNETGTAHIAALSGKKTFIICGYGDAGSFVPYPHSMEGKTVFSIFSDRKCSPCRWKNSECNRKKVFPCVSEITLQKVFDCIVMNTDGV